MPQLKTSAEMDPEIRETLTQINELLRSKNLTGAFIVSNTKGSGAAFRLSADWNAINYDFGSGKVELQMRTPEGMTEDEHIEKMAKSITFLLGLLEVTRHQRDQVKMILEGISGLFMEYKEKSVSRN